MRNTMLGLLFLLGACMPDYRAFPPPVHVSGSGGDRWVVDYPEPYNYCAPTPWGQQDFNFCYSDGCCSWTTCDHNWCCTYEYCMKWDSADTCVWRLDFEHCTSWEQ